MRRLKRLIEERYWLLTTALLATLVTSYFRGASFGVDITRRRESEVVERRTFCRLERGDALIGIRTQHFYTEPDEPTPKFLK